jgi:Pam16
MVSAPRLITQVVLVGGKIVFRAFLDAYKVAAQNTAKTAISQHSASKDSITRLTGMDLDEAQKILNLESNLDRNVDLEVFIVFMQKYKTNVIQVGIAS